MGSLDLLYLFIEQGHVNKLLSYATEKIKLAFFAAKIIKKCNIFVLGQNMLGL